MVHACESLFSTSRKLTSALLVVTTASVFAAQHAEGSAPRSMPQRLRGGFSLAQRWAQDTKHGIELKGDELALYIATGKMPAQALALLEPQQDSKNQTNATEEEAYAKQADEIMGNMKAYEKKLDDVRSKAEVAYTALSEQEKRLTANFFPIKKMLEGLIKTAATVAAKAEAQTMLDRLTRMHYKQVGTLDRSAAYWLEVSEKEKEARRVAEAHEQLQLAAFNATEKRFDAEKEALKKAAAVEKAEVDQWRQDMWTELEAEQKAGALKLTKPCKQEVQVAQVQAATPADARNMVPAVAGQVIVSSSATVH